MFQCVNWQEKGKMADDSHPWRMNEVQSPTEWRHFYLCISSGDLFKNVFFANKIHLHGGGDYSWQYTMYNKLFHLCIFKMSWYEKHHQMYSVITVKTRCCITKHCSVFQVSLSCCIYRTDRPIRVKRQWYKKQNMSSCRLVTLWLEAPHDTHEIKYCSSEWSDHSLVQDKIIAVFRKPYGCSDSYVALQEAFSPVGNM